MRIALHFAFIALFLAAIAALPAASQEVSGETGKTPVVGASQVLDDRVVAVLFRADWCPSCRILEPKLDQVEIDENNIDLVTFDVTTDETAAAAEALADKLGLTALYEDNKRKTGQVLLLNPRTMKVVDTITRDLDVGDINARFDGAVTNIRIDLETN